MILFGYFQFFYGIFSLPLSLYTPYILLINTSSINLSLRDYYRLHNIVKFEILSRCNFVTLTMASIVVITVKLGMQSHAIITERLIQLRDRASQSNRYDIPFNQYQSVEYALICLYDIDRGEREGDWRHVRSSIASDGERVTLQSSCIAVNSFSTFAQADSHNTVRAGVLKVRRECVINVNNYQKLTRNG